MAAALNWKTEVLRCISFLGRDFHLTEIYRFIPELQRRAPLNRHVAEKIRQQLQVLVADGSLERMERGMYRRIDPSAAKNDWPFTRGQFVTRADIAAVLDVGEPALRRGMFKPARGPTSRRMVLFSDLQKNPYQDRKERGRFVYTGERGLGEGRLTGHKATLAEHTALGVEVHLFTTSAGEPGKQHYEGQVVVERWREVFRPERGEKLFEFDLVPADARTQGKNIQRTFEPDLDFHLAKRTRMESISERTIRDRAFRDYLLPAYDHKYAVCGPTLASDRYRDIQAAHILAVCDDGPDTPTNGLALCARHHWAFDHGIFSLSDELEVLTAENLVDPHRELKHGAPVRRPSIPEWMPRSEFLGLHRRKWDFT